MLSLVGPNENAKAMLIGLSEAGFVDGRNVTVERVSVYEPDRIPAVVAELVRRKVAVIYGLLLVAVVAKAATATIPIVFGTTDDPVEAGVVASYGRPGGNVTGVRFRAGDEPTKLMQLLHELVPAAVTIGVLALRSGVGTARDIASVEAAAQAVGVKVIVAQVSAENEFESAIASFADAKAGAVFISDHRYFVARYQQIVASATQHGLPAVSTDYQIVAAGGLAAYGSNIRDGIRQTGIYIGRILKGEKPADLPVLQPTKFKFVVNLKSAKALGLTIPEAMLLRADEVIE